MHISRDLLTRLYLQEHKSAKQISRILVCSENKVNYWLKKFAIPKRNISEALYLKRNPQGDPFCFVEPKSNHDYFLLGLGLGLYWGEGNKKNKYSVRLGNTNPFLIHQFITFLRHTYQVRDDKLRFGLQIFSDTKSHVAEAYWARTLRISKKQFFKTVVTPSRGRGTYKEKALYGVLTVYVSNTKLQADINQKIEKLSQID